ncbi:MAG TPA: DNA integrity scanning protein DisA, partial [Firmicutes bacterium]|nr:DNA integrity scanning protein DisA [Bacillota bacterium]
TAERVAKQTGQMVISISQRRNVITIYKDNWKHVVREVSVILSKANQALSTLEKYRSVFQQSLTNLSALEFEDLVTLSDVTTVLQRSQMVNRIAKEIERYVVQLGSEGRLVKMQLEELLADIKDQGLLVFKDYYVGENLAEAWSQMEEWDSDDFLNVGMLSKALGYSSISSLEQPAAARGYRILAKIPRLPMPVIENLVDAFGSLSAIMDATIEELDDVEGIGEVRAKAIRDGLRRLREQVLVDSHI